MDNQLKASLSKLMTAYASSHINTGHDDLYYRKPEIDTKLSGVSKAGHTHTKSQITDFPTSMPASDVYSWAKASSKPSYALSELTSDATHRTVTDTEKSTWDAKASLASPTFTGAPKAPTAAAGTNTTQIATTAFVTTAISNGLAASDAMIIKGTIGISGTVTTLPTTYKTGWTYRVVTAGTYAGQACEIGDLIIALVDRDGSSNANSDWCVAQTNINGAITSVKGDDSHISVSQSGSTVTISHSAITRTNSTSTSSPSHGGTLTIVKSITSDNNGHITGVTTETVTLPSDNNTKNTAGSTNTSSKIYLIGATSQAANPQTYSHDTAYIGTNGHLYSDSKQVVNLSGNQALTNKTYNGYTLAAACARGVTTSATSGSTSLITSGGVYTAFSLTDDEITAMIEEITAAQ